jgi:cell division protease FtsH
MSTQTEKLATTRPSFREWVAALALAVRRVVSKRRKGAHGRGLFRALVLGAILLLLLLGMAINFLYLTVPGGRQVSLDEVVKMGTSGQLVNATFLDEDAQLTGSYCTVVPPAGAGCPSGHAAHFWARYLKSDALADGLLTKLSSHARVVVDSQPLKTVTKFFVQFLLPIVLLADLFGIVFVARSGQGSITDLVGFASIGRKRARKRRQGTGVTFDDVAGADEAVAELREVRDYLVDPKRYKESGAQPPKGVLLFGPPGCGKTLLARAVAGESGVPFFSISGAEFVESLVGVGAARVRDLFRRAAQAAPAIVFIDELDAAGRKRGAGFSGGSDEREQTLNQMLVAMDGFEITSGIVVIGATNRPDILDPALLRPGRFDRHVTVDQPDVEGRLAILKLHARGKRVAPTADFEAIARRTAGFTGADLANVVNEAVLLSLREERPEAGQEDLYEAIQRVLHGPKRRGRLISEAERERVATHEAGHVIVAAAMGALREHQRVSIVARGRGLGQLMSANDQDRVLLTRSELVDEMVVAVAGVAAESVCLGEHSTAGESDVQHVSDLARQMVARYGMSDHFGPLRLAAHEGNGFLGQEEVAAAGIVSQATLRELDEEVIAAVGQARDRAVEILKAHQGALQSLTAKLLEVETIEGTELLASVQAVLPAVAGVAIA